MSKGKRELTKEEKQLWRRVAESVRRRRAAAPEEEHDSPAEPPAALRVKSRQPAPSQPPPPRSAKPTPLADRGGEKRVRRGRLEVAATLDLHGHTQVTARTALSRFLRAAAARGDRTVIVVTGVGRAGQGVLRQLVPEWLADHDLRPLIAGYAQAHRVHGGAGAYYVFLKRPVD